MKPNKSKKILVIVIILVILIIGAGVIFAFSKTDLMKSNKEKFFQYITQIGDEDLNKYFQKKQTVGYENNSRFWTEITKNGKKLEALKNMDNFSITSTGKVDEANNKSEQTIKINYSNELSIPTMYRQINNIIGIKNNYLSKSKFFAIEEGKSVVEGIPLIAISKNSEELKNNGNSVVIEKYLSILNENLKDSYFSKETDNDRNIYKLTIKPDDLKNTIIQLLNTFVSDEIALKYISDDTDATKQNIKGVIESSENISTESEDNITVALTVKSKVLEGIEIKYQGVSINIKKTKSENELIYEILAGTNEKEDEQLYLNIKYSGLKMMEKVDETYELGLNIPYSEVSKENKNEETKENNNEEYEDIKLSVKQEKEKVEFLIADAKSNRMLNNENTENLTFDNIQKTLETKTDSSYTRMKLEKESDTTYNITFTDTKDKFTLDVSGKIIKEPEQNNNSSGPIDASNEEVEDLTGNQGSAEPEKDEKEQTKDENNETNEDNNQEKADFLNYVYKITNTNLFVNSVEIDELNEENSIILTKKDEEYNRKLLNKIMGRIEAVNKAAMKKIGATSELQNPITLLNPDSISRIQQMDSVGENLSDIEIKTFNDKFKIYESTNQTGASTKGLLTVIQNNNSEQDGSKNKIKQISFDGQNYEANEQNITLVKSSIDTAKEYKVEFEVDENTGLIYRAVINVK